LLHSYSTFQAIANATDIDAPSEDAGNMLSTTASRATARRLRRARQSLGTYRHDLLVAMRVVNGVEAQMIQSEWENWLADESAQCDQVRAMLRLEGGTSAAGEAKRPAASADSTGGPDKGRRREALKLWHEQYCGSCEMERQALLAARDASSLVL
jgi:hypothetical protein